MTDFLAIALAEAFFCPVVLLLCGIVLLLVFRFLRDRRTLRVVIACAVMGAAVSIMTVSLFFRFQLPWEPTSPKLYALVGRTERQIRVDFGYPNSIYRSTSDNCPPVYFYGEKTKVWAYEGWWSGGYVRVVFDENGRAVHYEIDLD